ncbi:hypothetical protein [Streptomyces sp. NPDC101234]|uniref:hypothetical protein n=1 Tax=Streptomyces sp. NPDC101234 TaxID=3366138 RepID=UPI0038309F43
MQHRMDFQLYGAIAATQVVLPAMRRAGAGTLLYTTGAGSIDRVPQVGKVKAADPGQTATDFTGGLGHSVTEGAESIVTLATIGPDGPAGQFIDRSENRPW